MTKVKKLYCAIHQRWYDPSKGPCPLCEKGVPGVPVVDNSKAQLPPQFPPQNMPGEFFAIPLDSPDNIIMDPDSLKHYQEEMRRRAEETYKRIRLFRIINILSAVAFIAVFIFLLFI